MSTFNSNFVYNLGSPHYSEQVLKKMFAEEIWTRTVQNHLVEWVRGLNHHHRRCITLLHNLLADWVIRIDDTISVVYMFSKSFWRIELRNLNTPGHIASAKLSANKVPRINYHHLGVITLFQTHLSYCVTNIHIHHLGATTLVHMLLAD